jgi:hypothetical protein
MIIEISPSQATDSELVLFTAVFTNNSVHVAAITDAPHDIATKWAETMKELHGGKPVIRRAGVCRYCGSTERRGDYCGNCDRVFWR